MTVRAVLADVGEDRLNVALNAFHFFVHTAQWIFRFVVIEFWDNPDRSPAGRGMAIFAWDIDRAVGIAGSLILFGRERSRQGGGGRSGPSRCWRDTKYSPESELEQRERRSLRRRDRARDHAWPVENLYYFLTVSR